MMFATFSHSTHTLGWLNLLYLMLGVAFMPVPAAVLLNCHMRPDRIK
jgi:hypothetical protein